MSACLTAEPFACPQLSGEFEDPHLQEAVRIVSMRLHITSYSPAAVKEYAHLPTIHIEGETVGSGANVRHRSMHGTVSVVADGSVRWQIVSCAALPLSEPYWD